MGTEGDTERKIIDAAKTEFVKRGRGGARMQSIANEAGVNKALLHYYFRSKDQLFVRVVEEVFAEVVAMVAEKNDDTSTFESFLRDFVARYSTFLRTNREITLFLLWELPRDVELFRLLAHQTRAQAGTTPFHIVARRLSDAAERGEIRKADPFHFFMNFIGMMALFNLLTPLITTGIGVADSRMERLIGQRDEEVFRVLWTDLQKEST